MFKLVQSPDRFRIYGVPSNEFFFANPSLAANGDAANYELGLRFLPSVNGLILGLKYWKAPTDNSIHIGRLWSDTGTLLASVLFANETSGGWQQQYLTTPQAVTANTYYRISVNAINGYAYTVQGFASSLIRGNLFAPVAAGIFIRGSGEFPHQTYRNNNYYRDLIFRAS